MRKAFFDFLDELLKDRPLESKVYTIKSIKNEWLNVYLNKLLKDQKCCEHCHKYSPTSDFIYSKETVIELDWYHDSELEAKKVYLFSICPKCNVKSKEKIISQKAIRWL